MTFEEYKKWVKSRLNSDKWRLSMNSWGQMEPVNVTRLTLGGLGLATEAGEVGDLAKKYAYHGKPFNEIAIKMRAEMGDTLWYFALICGEMGWTLDDIIQDNVDKLTARDGVHGEKFNERS